MKSGQTARFHGQHTEGGNSMISGEFAGTVVGAQGFEPWTY